MLGHHRPTSEMPFIWRFADGPMMARFCGTWIILIFPSSKKKKKLVRNWPPLTKLSGSAHGPCWRQRWSFASVLYLISSKWVRSENTTITRTHCRPTHDTVQKSHSTLTVTRHQEDHKSKQPTLSFPTKFTRMLSIMSMMSQCAEYKNCNI